jgi:signal transduction histidine kinase
VTDFLTALVHELRTPLTALKGSLGLLSAMAGDLPPDAAQFSTLAVRNAGKLAGLLDDVAAYVRVREPERSLAIVSVDLFSLLEWAAERVQPVAEERGVTVSASVVATDLPAAGFPEGEDSADPPGLSVPADEELLRDAVARLLFYAVRVTPKDGRVMVGAEVVSSRVVLRVADQGQPVAEPDVAAMFAPFSAVARRGVDGADRAGLDLTIARLIAERHDGTLEYRQITGGGVLRMTLGA